MIARKVPPFCARCFRFRLLKPELLNGATNDSSKVVNSQVSTL